ncbi:MAG: coproporphyrinogen III oxidase, partial [Gammaproteobacteria bacterium]|nr:coproporphyrinogen III oxidase [Gammaproteobacteria bacterium]
MEINIADRKAGLGGYFVANYPPFSFWSRPALDDIYVRLEKAGEPDLPLGIYVHIPFCRRRCDFCYFRVYTRKSSSEIDEYIKSVVAELEIYTRQPYLADRKAAFIYFGGGTPSYLSTDQTRKLS